MTRSVLQVCLNGARTAGDHPALPVTAAALAAEAAGAVAAGARDIHLHPKDAAGRDTLAPDAVGAALGAVRAALPRGVGVGVTTGAWAEPDAGRRVAAVRAWRLLPDHASVNWHEPGAEDVAAALLERGVGVEAGLWSGTDGAARFAASALAPRVLRVLAEVTDTVADTAGATARALLEEIGETTGGRGAPGGHTVRAVPGDHSVSAAPGGHPVRAAPGGHPVRAAPGGHPVRTAPEGNPVRAAPGGRPVLLHGEDAGAWPVLRLAVELGLMTRIGLEDVLTLPDGRRAASNADLVRAALAGWR